jgi:hypothetical protein
VLSLICNNIVILAIFAWGFEECGALSRETKYGNEGGEAWQNTRVVTVFLNRKGNYNYSTTNAVYKKSGFRMRHKFRVALNSSKTKLNFSKLGELSVPNVTPSTFSSSVWWSELERTKKASFNYLGDSYVDRRKKHKRGKKKRRKKRRQEGRWLP